MLCFLRSDTLSFIYRFGNCIILHPPVPVFFKGISDPLLLPVWDRFMGFHCQLKHRWYLSRNLGLSTDVERKDAGIS